MHEMVNLLADLREERFGADALARARREIEAAGFSMTRVEPGDGVFLAWIDEIFGGTWSSEAFAGASALARSGETIAGFATYDPRGLRFSWLRGYARREGVGIFGPFGVAPAFRGSSAGRNLLTVALASLRERGYAQALIPAVGEEKLVDYYAEHAGARIVERVEKASFRARTYRTVVLASGNGSNFQSVLDGAREGRLPLEIAALVSNDPRAYALVRAREAGIRTVELPWNRGAESRVRYDASLRETVARQSPDLVLLLGWMHLLDAAFVSAFPETINIHPAFLPLDQRQDTVELPDGSTIPAYRGAHAVRDARRDRSPWVGASAHRVNLGTDRGPILVRRPLQVQPGEDEGSLMKRLHPLEHGVLAGALMRWVYER